MVFVPTNEAVQWCNEAIKSEVLNVTKYTHALELGLIALIIGVVLVEIMRIKSKKYYEQRIEMLNNELINMKNIMNTEQTGEGLKNA